MKINTIAVIGAGTMGAGIAQLAVKHGCTVHLIDVNSQVLDRGWEGIAKRFAQSVEKGRISDDQRTDMLGRIKKSTSIENLQDVELAIEAVVENLEVKHKVFASLEQATGSTTILATNTSSLSISAIAESVKKPERVIGMHFFNPAPVMPLVEIIAGSKSESAAVDAGYQAAKDWGKTPVRVKDTPGFIVNRVARGFYLEALRLLDEGVAGVDEIDKIMRNHAGFKMGPFELMDLIGIDINLAVSRSVYQQMGEPARLLPHPIQKELVEAGHTGRKAGRGFYLHDGGSPLPAYPVDRKSFELSLLLQDVMHVFATQAGADQANSTEQYVLCRILVAIMNEAGLALGDEIATRQDIDTAMIKGTNYPKGPLAWADEVSPRTVRGLLKNLNEVTGDGRYEPAPYFVNAD